jgi:DnaJ-class molecular chaperone
MRGPTVAKASRFLPILAAGLLLLLAACSKTCPSCSGEGVLRVSAPCETCGGSGVVKVACESCGGHGRLGAGGVCPRCQGKRSVTCDYTESLDMEVTTADPSGRECPSYEKVTVVCRDGRLWPSQPLSEGAVPGLFRDNPSRTCPACGGRGQVTCPFCGGTGVNPGSGVCTACAGAGQVERTCATCGGKGVAVQAKPCPRCSGTGQVSRWGS